MSTKRYQLDNYRKLLINRVTITPTLTDYIEKCLSCEDDAASHTFHKVMIHNWQADDIQLFNTLMEYFAVTFVPVHFKSGPEITTFYTSSLNLILKMTKLDFMFPYCRNMFNIDILFNDKSSADCFENRVTVDEIVSGIVSNRLNDKYELDLSEFCSDPEFTQKNIQFYKVGLLAHFKILMLRMGKVTKSLNLSKNNLTSVPEEIMNFFIKCELIAINLSYNEIPSIKQLNRVSSKIEKLWIEGNPLCEDDDPVSYIKSVLVKFPRLNELDGIKLHQSVGGLPFIKNFLVNPSRRTKMIVEKFLTLYFSNYDLRRRKSITHFYNDVSKLSITTSFTDQEEQTIPQYVAYTRNALHPIRRTYVVCNNKLYKTKQAITEVLTRLPPTVHDPTTFTVDVLKHDNKSLVIIVDGLFKEKSYVAEERIFSFRRTFVFNISYVKANSVYQITNEMYNISRATPEQIANSFQHPIRNLNSLELEDPDEDEQESICNVFTFISQLKRPEVEFRLKIHKWDIRKACKELISDVRLNRISADRFVSDDDMTDVSDILDNVD